MRQTRRYVLLGVFLAMLITACNGPATTSAPEATPDPLQMLQKAAAEIQNAKSLRFKLQLTGAPAYVDTRNTIAFVSADGSFIDPNKTKATVVARLLGVPGEVQIIAIGDDQWLNNAVLTGNKWVKDVFVPGFNPEKLVKSEQGIQSAIKAFSNAKYIGKETLFGTEMYHLTATTQASEISALTINLIRGADVNADIYIDTQTGRVDHVIMVQPDTKTEKDAPTTWTLEVFDYNVDGLQIDAPQGAVTPGAATVPALPTLMPNTNPAATATAEATQPG